MREEQYKKITYKSIYFDSIYSEVFYFDTNDLLPQYIDLYLKRVLTRHFLLIVSTPWAVCVEWASK